MRAGDPQLRPLHLLRDALPRPDRGARLSRIVVVGVGNTLGGDDAAGPAVAELVRARAAPDVSVRVCEEEPTRLVDALAGAEAAILVDAVRTGAPPGTVHRFDAGEAPLPASALRSASTHAFGLAEALELARALGRLPARTVLFGVEGRDFRAGTGLSPGVADGVERAAETVLAELAARP